MADVIIIGCGPAGVSAALYTARAGLDTLIIAKDNGALSKAEKIENFYGLSGDVTGDALVQTGKRQVEALGVKIITDEVVGVYFSDKLSVKTTVDVYSAEAVIIATGVSRTAPKIPSIAEFEGRGVSYCAVCDAFFHKGRRVAVLGTGEYAKQEASELLNVTDDVVLLTNGEDVTTQFPEKVKIIKNRIEKLEGDTRLKNIVFENGEKLEVSGVFIAVGIAGSSDLAKKIGAQTDGRKIVIKENMATNVPGLFAAGDCTGGMLQVAKAVYEGAAAGEGAIKYIKKLKTK